MATFYFAKEMLNGTRKFGSVEAPDFDAAFDKIYSNDSEIISIGATKASVSEDVFCQDNDC